MHFLHRNRKTSYIFSRIFLFPLEIWKNLQCSWKFESIKIEIKKSVIFPSDFDFVIENSLKYRFCTDFAFYIWMCKNVKFSLGSENFYIESTKVWYIVFWFWRFHREIFKIDIFSADFYIFTKKCVKMLTFSFFYM